MMTILVGESANVEYARVCSRPYGHWTADGGIRWLSVSRRRGAFRGEAARRKLSALGLCIGENIGESANLCLPGVWDVGLADQVAAMIKAMPFDRIFICGRKALGCFGIDFAPRWGQVYEERYVAVPHPSGRSRWWNDQRAVYLCAEMLVLATDQELFERGEGCRNCKHPIDLEDGPLCPACENKT